LSTIINKDKTVNPPKFDVLSPAIAYPLLILIFIGLGIQGMTFYSFLLFGVFIISFLLGFRFGRPGRFERYPIVWKLGFPLFVVGAVAEFINIIYVDSIPLLVPTMRSRLLPILSYLSFLIVPGCIIKLSDALLNRRNREAIGWLLAGTFLISLLGYRTEIFALLLGAAISFYYIKARGVKPRKAIKYGIIFVLLLVAINLGVVLFREMPVASTMDRLSFTTYVFSSMADSMGLSLFGQAGGVIHTSILSSIKAIPGPRTGPRTFISQLVGVGGGSTTPTIIGIPFIDFGIAGIVITGILLGLLFGSGYKMLRRGDVDILPIHALCMAFLLITIETGIADTIVLIYLIAYLLLVI
jgi:oligosaccharide repeat unit polymerase